MKKRFATYSEENGLKLTSNHGLFEEGPIWEERSLKPSWLKIRPSYPAWRRLKTVLWFPQGSSWTSWTSCLNGWTSGSNTKLLAPVWSSMVDLVGNGTYDLSLAAFILSFERSFLVDFSFPLLRTSVKIFYKRVNSDFGEPLDFVTFFPAF